MGHGIHCEPEIRRHHTLVHIFYRSLFSMALAYLAVDCHLSSEEGRRQLGSADSKDLCHHVDL